MTYKNNLRQIILPLVLALVFAGGFLARGLFPYKTKSSIIFHKRQGSKIENLLNLIDENYVDSVEVEDLIEMSIPQILSHLDPHSTYIPAQDYEEVNAPLEGNFEGIGIQFNIQDDTVVVIQTISGGPSEKIGIMPGDRIVTINDTVFAGKNIDSDDIVSRLKGPRGTKVRVGVKRRGFNNLLKFDIPRDKIPLYSVDVAYMIDKTTGFIKISRFARTTPDEFISSVKKLKRSGCTKFILDLRSNGGGYLDAATRIADEFLDGGKLIVYTEGKARRKQEIMSKPGGLCVNDELIILIDPWSASASEILAGAIQDNDRGRIIGQRSFGKGLVQEPIQFADGSSIRLTVARYYTPTGRCIQKPYTDEEDYENDIVERYKNGEFTHLDTSKFSDSLKYVTPGGKVVYGGGGIMPDIFVPSDTAFRSEYFGKLAEQGLIYRFAFIYSDENRDALEKLKTWQQFDSLLTRQKILDRFVKFSQSQGVSPKPGELQRSGKVIDTQIRAYIARNFIDNDGFYPIISRIDETLTKAVETIEQSHSLQNTIQ